MHDIKFLSPCQCKNRPKLSPNKTWRRMPHAAQVKFQQDEAKAHIQDLEAIKEALLLRRHLRERVRHFESKHDDLLQRLAEEIACWMCDDDDDDSDGLLRQCELWMQDGDPLTPSFFSL
ncbi:hypothetical protein LEN26_015594 [Aphanomyces euteiches]|uniref:Uncharacterized protein n=1 Tax=Aphanomyces euteiches TaxID=100861 RepID=A0A6G0XD26_9STRA|nr:hypothetical protein Ae201684_006056 [Aphanomyces euteiches]KAH9068619.1 hypothetical protein Ae201684P_004321 [Aphanomyces euteiches]KAH9102056.1 hypothetical protein LEN26_015594 [Aphanomyces euteiches]KAH9124532.1 hypothetical protein AeMF1_004725 [Aphanomyces euteiches]KAH9156316.1 hypothetical protein AeRB84_001778 [Aphanomyces euteiches]